MKKCIVIGLALCLLVFVTGCPPPKIFDNANVELTSGETVPHWVDKNIYQQGRLNLGALYQESTLDTEKLKIYSQMIDTTERIEVCVGPSPIPDSCDALPDPPGPNTYVSVNTTTGNCAADAILVYHLTIRPIPDPEVDPAHIEFTDMGVNTMLPTLTIHTVSILRSALGTETVHQFKIRETSTCDGASIRIVDGAVVEAELTRDYFYYVRQADGADTTSPEITQTYPSPSQTGLPVDVIPWFETDQELGYVAAFVCIYTSGWTSLDTCYQNGVEVAKGPSTYRYTLSWREDLEANTWYGFTIFVGYSDNANPGPGTRSHWVTKGTQDINGNLIEDSQESLVNIGDNIYYDADMWVYRYRFITAP